MIYFIQDSSTLFIKIGRTDGDPENRLKALQTGNPSGLVLLLEIEDEPDLETYLHKVFASYRERGEWFRPGPRLIAYMLEVTKENASDDARYWYEQTMCWREEALESRKLIVDAAAEVNELLEERSKASLRGISRSVVDAIP